MLKPLEGGKALFYPYVETGLRVLDTATVVKVWGDTCVNLITSDGRSPTSVLVRPETDETLYSEYCVLLPDGNEEVIEMAEPEALAGSVSDAQQVRHLHQAQSLPVIEPYEGVKVWESDDPEHITHFKDASGRNMRVVHDVGGLAAMPYEKPQA